jgi:hypothetical protein
MEGIKSQALADFVAEWTKIQQPAPDTFLDQWKMYFDGSLKLGGAAQVFFSYPQKENSLNTCSRYYGKPQIMKHNMKHSSMG